MEKIKQIFRQIWDFLTRNKQPVVSAIMTVIVIKVFPSFVLGTFLILCVWATMASIYEYVEEKWATR